ncbi:hypothetical protein DSO57_1011662 [Entomophthora muscae]|uniref:Uncharacterized protein n=1 Tax=Entomophthora muscae TaxID=34485 RepID=A0ACC2RX73_9FUNG|nr:hypothetical protein DSO57_1011662 [Entomophthora muscae]
MVVMINFHTPRLAGNFLQASQVYRHLVNDTLTTQRSNQTKTHSQTKAEKKLLDEEYLNDIAAFGSDFAAYLFSVKFYADQCFNHLQESKMLSFKEKFHNLNTQFGMDLILSHDNIKASVLKCAANYYFNVICLATQP